jgi:hypothetical protein
MLALAHLRAVAIGGVHTAPPDLAALARRRRHPRPDPAGAKKKSAPTLQGVYVGRILRARSPPTCSAGIAYNKADGTSITTQAKAVAAGQGYVDGQNNVTVTVNQPPKSGNYTGTSTAIEVIVQQPQPRFLAGLFQASNPTVNARAVARVSNPSCLLALDTTANQAINVSGSASVSSKCDLASNSSSANAINMSGSSTVTTPCLQSSGGVSVTSGPGCTSATHRRTT